jgi:hypothetical protein
MYSCAAAAAAAPTPGCSAAPVALQDAEVASHVGTLQRCRPAEPVLNQLALLREQHEEATELAKSEAPAQANTTNPHQTAAAAAAVSAWQG